MEHNFIFSPSSRLFIGTLFCLLGSNENGLLLNGEGDVNLAFHQGQGTKEVFTKYLSDGVIQLHVLCQRSYCESVLAQI